MYSAVISYMVLNLEKLSIISFPLQQSSTKTKNLVIKLAWVVLSMLLIILMLAYFDRIHSYRTKSLMFAKSCLYYVLCIKGIHVVAPSPNFIWIQKVPLMRISFGHSFEEIPLQSILFHS